MLGTLGLKSLLNNVPKSVNIFLENMFVDVKGYSEIVSRSVLYQVFATTWSVAHQAPLSMGFSRQEYWSGKPCPSPGYPSDPGITPRSPALQADSLPSEPPGNTHADTDKKDT